MLYVKYCKYQPHLYPRSLTVCKYFGIPKNVQFHLMFLKHGSIIGLMMTP